MRKLSLFSGICGIDLAAHWAGMETVAFCEREPFPQSVIRKHFPGHPIYDDVCTLTAARLKEDGIIGPGRTIDIISAGYPCQPESLAGNRKGKDDDRWLWPEAARVIQELRPRWFIGENVAGHISMGLPTVLADLENLNYEAQAIVVPSCSVGAPHRRDRVFIVADSNGEPGLETDSPACSIRSKWHAWDDVSRSSRRYEPGADRGPTEPGVGGVLDGLSDWLDGYRWPAGLGQPQHDWEPPRVASGVKDRAPRLKGLGNAVNPVQVFPILYAIKQINDQLELSI